jgi:hypothetical protein
LPAIGDRTGFFCQQSGSDGNEKCPSLHTRWILRIIDLLHGIIAG